MVIFIGLWFLLGLPFFLFGLRSLRWASLIKNTPTAKIGSVAIGLAELHGRVIPKEGMVSPITQKPCLGWEVSICEEGRSDGQATSFNTLWKELRFEFYLEDESGKILVQLDQTRDFNDLQQVLWQTSQYSEFLDKNRNSVRREDMSLWGKPEYASSGRQYDDFTPQVLEFAQRQGFDLRGGKKRRCISVKMYEKIVGTDSVLGRNTSGYTSLDGNYYIMGTVLAAPEQLAGKNKIEDRVVRRDPQNRVFVFAPIPPKRMERTQRNKAIAQFCGAAFCGLMGLGIFAPHVAAVVALSYIIIFFGSALVGALILKRQPEPGVLLIAFLVCFLAFFALFTFQGALNQLLR